MVDKDKPIKILMVDDDQMMRIFFRDIFWVHGRDEHYKVSITSTLIEADGLINDKETRPDVLFLDMMIPLQKGDDTTSSQLERSVEFITKLKKDPELSKIKIVVFSGHKDSDFQKKILSLGVNAYLIKGDFMPKEIIEFVDSIHV